MSMDTNITKKLTDSTLDWNALTHGNHSCYSTFLESPIFPMLHNKFGHQSVSFTYTEIWFVLIEKLFLCDMKLFK